MKSLLDETDIADSKAFLRSFVKRIEINNSEAEIQYNLPMPPYWSEKQSAGVLPIDNFGGAPSHRSVADLNQLLPF